MNNLEFSKLSLRDLGMLVGLVAHKRIAPVAAEFRVSPSAVSYALDRLRSALGDELLVRTHNGFRPTRDAHRYAGEARAFLDQMQTVRQKTRFDPDATLRSFTLVATEYELSSFLGSVLSDILAHYPRLSVRIVQTSSAIEPNRLHEDVDIALLPVELAQSGLVQEKLFDDPYTVFHDANHRTPDALEAFCTARHAVMNPAGQARSNIDTALSRIGLSRHVAMVAPNFYALANIMRGSDLIATLPSRLSARTFSGFATAVPPIQLDPMPVFLTHARSKSTDPGVIWLLEKLRAAAGRDQDRGACPISDG